MAKSLLPLAAPPEGALAVALGRWSAVSARLGLDEAASDAGALLLGSELDEALHERLVDDKAGAIAPRVEAAIAAAARVARLLCLHGGRVGMVEEDLREAVRLELLKSGSSVQAARWQRS